MANTVNGKKVEYIDVKRVDGNIRVLYSPIFNICIANEMDTYKRLYDNNIWVHSIIYKDYENQIIIYPYKNEERKKIIKALNLPEKSYKLNKGLIIVNKNKILEELIQ